jgi:hypothetical protein
MKLIDVIEKLSKGEIKDGTILTVKARNNKRYKYIENCFLDDYNYPLNIYGERDLNSEVIFIEPKPKKYYLRLYGAYKFNDYVNRHNEDFDYSYIIDDGEERNGYYTKFTQEEIDDDKFLKFIEKYGVKVEVED